MMFDLLFGAASHGPLIGLTLIIVLGIGTSWLAWQLKAPSILLLLIVGFVIGPGAALLRQALGGDPVPLLNPDALLGDLLIPMVSVSVALILFEGGMSLRLRELREARGPIINLCTTGAVVTGILGTLFAYWLLDQGWPLAVILGAMLTVTGPTVIGPMLRHIRPTHKVNAVAKWEGIVIDPIGAMLGVLAFVAIEAIQAEGVGSATWQASLGMLQTVAVGSLIGLVGAVPMIFLIRKYIIPDFLQSPVMLMVVVACFTASNMLAEESGLFAVTLMGLVVGNQKSVSVQHLVQFKENLRVMLIGWLFIVLAARLQVSQVWELLEWRNLAFVLAMMFIVRPICVFTSTFGSDLTLNEKIFLCWMAPRGIVAAALASIFTLRLEQLGDSGGVLISPDADLVPIVFLVIVVTVSFYGLTAAPLARWLGVAQPNPQGVLIASCHPGARAVGHALHDSGFRVLLVDSNPYNVQTARMEGLATVYASILSEHAVDEINFGGIGRFMAMTRNDEVNSLATFRFSEIFGRAEVYQLAPNESGRNRRETAHELIRGRRLFAADATYGYLDQRFSAGAVVKKTRLTKDFGYDAFQARYGGEALLLFIVNENGNLQINTADQPLSPKPGDTIACLVQPIEEPSDPATAGSDAAEA